FAGSCEGQSLRLNVRVWNKPDSPAQTFEVSGSLLDFFGFQDRLTDRVVQAIRAIYPDLPAPDKSARLKLAPARTLKAYALAIRGKIAMQKGEGATARPLFLKALEADTNLWWAHYWLGALEFLEGKFQAAIGHCKRALDLDPDLYPAIYANLSYCWAGLGDTANANKNQAEFERRTGKRLPERSLPPIR
ncbi:MAG: tetratricopeptide repeat protein, partial [Armatimonadota bacterium]